jgi:hypothetical protein
MKISTTPYVFSVVVHNFDARFCHCRSARFLLHPAQAGEIRGRMPPPAISLPAPAAPAAVLAPATEDSRHARAKI